MAGRRAGGGAAHRASRHHDVEEALLLCERVLVLADGHIDAELDVDVPRGGTRRETVTSPAFLELRERALEAIG